MIFLTISLTIKQYMILLYLYQLFTNRLLISYNGMRALETGFK
jgi:hypothetical protein